MYKFWRVCGIILLCIAFAFSCYFALADKVVKADSNTSAVNLVYSNNTSTSGMPDYIRFILNNEPFYNVNSFRGITYDYYFPMEDYYGKAKIAYWDFYCNSSSEAQNLYNYFNNATFNSTIFTINYYNSYSFRVCARGGYDVELSGNNVFCWVLAYPENFWVEKADNTNNKFDLPELSFEFYSNNNTYLINFALKNIPLESPSPYIYVNYNIYNNIDFHGANDVWGYATFRGDYFKINYDVFNYYYFNYGNFEELTNNTFWKGNNYNFNFKSSDIDNIVLTPSNNYGNFWGWHADSGVILNKVSFNSTGVWTSFKNLGTQSLEFSFNYYVENNIVNSFNGTNSNFDSTSLYRQDVQWYDIFGHLYNFLIYLLFDMPLISNITKPIYMLISGTTTTFNWLAGLISGLGIFGAFAMVYLLFAIIKRFL